MHSYVLIKKRLKRVGKNFVIVVDIWNIDFDGHSTDPPFSIRALFLERTPEGAIRTNVGDGLIVLSNGSPTMAERILAAVFTQMFLVTFFSVGSSSPQHPRYTQPP